MIRQACALGCHPHGPPLSPLLAHYAESHSPDVGGDGEGGMTASRESDVTSDPRPLTLDNQQPVAAESAVNGIWNSTRHTHAPRGDTRVARSASIASRVSRSPCPPAQLMGFLVPGLSLAGGRHMAGTW